MLTGISVFGATQYHNHFFFYIFENHQHETASFSRRSCLCHNNNVNNKTSPCLSRWTLDPSLDGSRCLACFGWFSLCGGQRVGRRYTIVVSPNIIGLCYHHVTTSYRKFLCRNAATSPAVIVQLRLRLRRRWQCPARVTEPGLDGGRTRTVSLGVRGTEPVLSHHDDSRSRGVGAR